MISLDDTHPTMLLVRGSSAQHGRHHLALRPNLRPRSPHAHAYLKCSTPVASREIMLQPMKKWNNIHMSQMEGEVEIRMVKDGKFKMYPAFGNMATRIFAV